MLVFFGKSCVGAKGMITLRRFLYNSSPYLYEITQQNIHDEALFLVRLLSFMGFLNYFFKQVFCQETANACFCRKELQSRRYLKSLKNTKR